MRIGVRTWHLMSMAYLVGGTALGTPLADQEAVMWNTFASGLVFIALELHASFIWLFQLKGWAVMLKMMLLGSALFSSTHPLPYFLAALVIGGISSHMPGKYRYYSPWHGRVVKQ